MRSVTITACVLASLFAISPAWLYRSVRADEPPNFSREVLPILAENCFACHGPDVANRQSDLRLDQRELLLKSVSLDDPKSSSLLVRVRSTDEQTQMPPPTSHKKTLSAAQTDLIERWLKAGATWGKHWSFELPVKGPLPQNGYAHPVDAWVVQKLQAENLTLAPRAPQHTLLRRLSFDLVGLPPPPNQQSNLSLSHQASNQGLNTNDATSNDRGIEAQIDELLASPQYGERMAMWWLDVARYADTDGFQADATRTNWPWRDWVVDAFNQNMPFDQFTIEQFAGDLLPDATADQKLATCFHRNHMTNGEGGRDPEESRVDYVIDRVNTMGTVWLGLTLGCCQCHTHKFDPISHNDYYSLSAFFNSIDEDGKAGSGAVPFLKTKSTKCDSSIAAAQRLVEERKPRVEQARQDARSAFDPWLNQQIAQTRPGYVAWHPVQATELASAEGTTLVQESDGAVQASGANPFQDDYRVTAGSALPRITGFKLEVLPHASHTAGALSRGKNGEFILTDIKFQVRQKGNSQLRDIKVATAISDHTVDKGQRNYGKVSDTLDDDPRNGWTTAGSPNTLPHVAVYGLAEPLVLQTEEEISIELRQRSTDGDANIGRFRIYLTDQRGAIFQKLEASPLELLAASTPSSASDIAEELREKLFEQFLEDHQPYQEPKSNLERAGRQLAEMKKAADELNVMVLAERATPRDTHVLVRGVWDKHGDKVDPNVPLAIAPWIEGQPKTRLGLAKWLTCKENPLTARVAVNHLWQLMFGQGLVRTQEDFGVQGDAPLHRELLDWLAVEFMEHDWDIKHLIRLIATSRTYQQSSSAPAELWARDPENRLLARGARFRLPSWMLRDSALRVAGLINLDVGGPPVRPYQPDGVWEELFMGRFNYEPSEGSAQYRRSLYAFWRRSIAPTFLFDSAQRRTCEVRVGRTNTPLQALTLLNDQTYLEASRTLATNASQAHEELNDQLSYLVRAVLSREPFAGEQKLLAGKVAVAATYYLNRAKEARQLLDMTGQQSTIEHEQLARRAALMTVASMLLNLDEAITHE